MLREEVNISNCIIYVKRAISAAHHLPRYNGACSAVHGHTWVIEVWCENVIDKNGFAVDFKDVKNIIDTLDHKTLNNIIEIPTAENLCLHLLKTISHIKKARVWESEDCYAEISNS